MCSSEYKTCGGDGSQNGIVDGASPCVEVAPNGSLTYKYLSSDCECKPKDLGSIGYSKANDTNINSDTFKKQAAELCNDYRNVVTEGDGCGNLYFKCAVNISSYPYSSTYCTNQTPTSSALKWVTSGSYQSASGAYGTITMYQNCDCPNGNYYTDCTRYRSTDHWELYCTAAGDHRNKESCFRETDVGIIKLDDSSKCVFRDGSSKWQKCKCREVYDSAVYPGCMTKYRGDPSSGKDDQACFENGVFKISYNGGDARNDSTCLNPNNPY